MVYTRRVEDARKHDAPHRGPADGLGVALGGGTARGLAHIGALAVLEEAGVRLRAISGTSLGAALAALYALGTPPSALEHLVRNQNTLELWAQGVDFGLHRGALVNGRRLVRWLDRKIFYGATFADVELPLAIACCDLETGRPVVVRDGSLAEAVFASSALPLVFAPAERDDRALIDGGFIEAVPFSALAELRPERMLGLHAGVDVESLPLIRALRRASASPPGRRWHRWARRLPARRPLGRLQKGLALALRGYAHGLRVPRDALLVRLEPPIGWWDFHRSPEAIAAGAGAMRVALENGLLDALLRGDAPPAPNGGAR